MAAPQSLAEGTGNLPRHSEQKIKATVHLYHLGMKTLVGGSAFEQDQEHVTSARETGEFGKLNVSSLFKYHPRGKQGRSLDEEGLAKYKTHKIHVENFGLKAFCVKSWANPYFVQKLL